MYSNLSISHFRGIADLEMRGLQRMNILLGKNNAGKTTVMEALFLLGGATTPSLPMTICHLRGQRVAHAHPDAVWRSLFYNMDPTTPISVMARWVGESRPRRLGVAAVMENRDDPAENDSGIASSYDEQVIQELRLTYTNAFDQEVITKAKYDNKSGDVDAVTMERSDFIRTTFLSARSYSSMERDARQFSHLVRIKEEQEIVDALKIIEPRVERIEVLSELGGPAVYVDLGLASLIPLTACGEGFVRFFSIVVEITGCRRGLLLIDEIDNGLHYSVMSQLWRLLHALCRQHDVQVIATTHNDELVTSAIDALNGDLADLAVFRLDRREGEHSAALYDAEMLGAVRRDNFEIRG